ncbi:right-handed parallel beta-helix repeat-containing protein [Hydrogenophaga sp. 2FB]|uniref:right-handed parallel beta-helix repeat-containing protein n=1 Tax=Hydrogenophaga sp. 2FB TaxID=2502187 RepID=UPI0010F8C89D|nr:right-handed parallel beta-helix repeat-containing protein [Hydrogenophaga sp. 2FB]
MIATLSACGGGGGGDGGSTGGGSSNDSVTQSPSPPLSGGAACNAAAGRVLEVGPGKTYAVPSAAAAVAQSGDVIKIAAGDYRGDAATWNDSNLTICGVGGRARLYADGSNAQGKGLWVVSGSNITIDNIEFRNAAVPDQNGAGIRAEHGGELRILNSGFYDNENGLLASAGNGSITIESSEFARNGRGDGYTHNIYVNQIERLTVNSSYFHEARIGHNLKSRARESIIQNSYFMDGPTGTSSYLADFPNGGRVVLKGNLFHKGPNADNVNAIAYGLEGLSNPSTTLELVHNTVAFTRSGGAFLSVAGGTSSVRLTANLFAGTGNQNLFASGYASGNAVQLNNVTSVASNIPGATNIGNPNFWPNAALQSLINLSVVPDASYTRDAPAPYASRAITGSRKVGALQAAP